MRARRAARRGKWAPVRTPLRRLTHRSHPSTEARAAAPAAPAGVLSGATPHPPLLRTRPSSSSGCPPPLTLFAGPAVRSGRRGCSPVKRRAHTRSAFECARSRSSERQPPSRRVCAHLDGRKRNPTPASTRCSSGLKFRLGLRLWELIQMEMLPRAARVCTLLVLSAQLHHGKRDAALEPRLRP